MPQTKKGVQTLLMVNRKGKSMVTREGKFVVNRKGKSMVNRGGKLVVNRENKPMVLLKKPY